MSDLVKKESCKGDVMNRIECERICPRSRMFFQTRECIVWVLWLLSIVVGALSVAVIIFVMSSQQYSLYHSTHDNFITFLIEALPFLWIIIFGLMAAVAVHNIRHTKSGYKYPLWLVLSSSVVLSLAGGAVLQIFGLGCTTDQVLGERMSMYDSLEKSKESCTEF